jgi:hypothetical protein
MNAKIMTENEVAESKRVLFSFLTEMKKWNDQCNAQDKRGAVSDLSSPRERLMEVITAFCTPRDLSCVGISYSKPSDWDPEEAIENIESVGEDEIHITTCRDNGPWKSRSRYILLRVGGNWKVDGRYSLHEEDKQFASMIAPKLARRSEYLWTLYEKYALASFAKQKRLRELVGESNWTFAKDTGILSFSNGIRWQCQILGSESESTFTWLWSWANTASEVPAALTQAALALKKFGEEKGIEHFTEPMLPINEVDGPFISTLASGIFNANGYYRAPYDGGAAFLLITDEKVPKIPLAAQKELENQFEANFSERNALSRRRALFDFLADKAYEMNQESSNLDPNEIGEDAEVEYDELGRITKIATTIPPDMKNSRKKLSRINKLISWLSNKK